MVKPVEAPRAVKFSAEPSVAKIASMKDEKVTVKIAAEFVAGAFYWHSKTKPEPLQDAWQYSPDQCLGVAEPAVRMVNRLEKVSPKAFKLLMSLVDPVALISATFALVRNSQEIERAKFAQLLNTDPELAARYRAAKNGNSPSGPIPTQGGGTQGGGFDAFRAEPARDGDGEHGRFDWSGASFDNQQT